MPRKLLFAAILATSAGLFGQTYTSPGLPQGMNQPASPPIVVAPPSPNIYIVGGGTYGTGVYLTPGGTLPVQGGAIYLTSPGTLPVQGTGISFGGRAGISLESPLQTGTATFLPSTIPGMPIYGAAPAAAGPTETATAETGRLINDLGPSYYEGGTTAAAPEPSLGEVAAYYKAQHPQNVRTFTNADAERLAGTVILPGAALVTGPPQAAQQAAPAEKPAAQNPPAAEASKPAASPPPTEPQVGAEKPAPKTPQTKQLPATSTLLPLLGLLGLVSGGVALLISKLRR